jgi:hypothetical protein
VTCDIQIELNGTVPSEPIVHQLSLHANIATALHNSPFVLSELGGSHVCQVHFWGSSEAFSTSSDPFSFSFILRNKRMGKKSAKVLIMTVIIHLLPESSNNDISQP